MLLTIIIVIINKLRRHQNINNAIHFEGVAKPRELNTPMR